MKNFAIIIVILSLVLGSAYILQQQEENIKKPSNELLYFPSGSLINQISLDYKTTVTNLMWLEIVQYYGQHMLTDKNLSQLYNLFDITTELDPNLLQCYVFGGTIITYDQKRPDLGMKILKKGMANLPDSWEVPFMAGFVNYTYTRDYFAAYRWFEFASNKKDAPYYCKTFAASSLKREGDYITAIKLWAQIYENSENRYEKENSIKNIITIMSLDFNKKMKESGSADARNYINSRLNDLAFLPFKVNVKITVDTVFVELL